MKYGYFINEIDYVDPVFLKYEITLKLNPYETREGDFINFLRRRYGAEPFAWKKYSYHGNILKIMFKLKKDRDDLKFNLKI